MACRTDAGARFWPDPSPNRRQSVHNCRPKDPRDSRKCASTQDWGIWPGGQMLSKKPGQFGRGGDAFRPAPESRRAPVVPGAQRRPRSRNPLMFKCNAVFISWQCGRSWHAAFWPRQGWNPQQFVQIRRPNDDGRRHRHVSPLDWVIWTGCDQSSKCALRLLPDSAGRGC